MEKNRRNEPSENVILEDASFVAALALNPKFTITPDRLPNGRVAFHIEGDGVKAALAEIYSNPQVGLHDYIKSLKNIRAILFDTKGNGNGHGKDYRT